MIEAETLVGQKLGHGRYHVKKKLGEGGMAYVLLAHDRNVDIEVVLKLPKPEILSDPEFAARFRREIRSMVELTHPHVVKVKDVGEHDGVPFYVMDLLTGGSLEDRFEVRDGVRVPQSPESLSVWLEPVARALDFIHKRFIHRDIKPANILFDAAGNAFVSDFGIVKAVGDSADSKKQTLMTQAGMVIGTCAYIAPEVTEGKKYDGRADQYALAATVYEVLCGRVPFDGDNLYTIIAQQLTGDVPPLKEVSPGLRRTLTPVLVKALSREPQNRYPNCEALARAVLECVRGPGSGRQAAPTPEPLPLPPEPAPTKPPAPKPTTGKRATCPSCGTAFAIPETAAGKRVRCPGCQSELAIPGKSASHETPRAPATDRATAAETEQTAAPKKKTAAAPKSPPPEPRAGSGRAKVAAPESAPKSDKGAKVGKGDKGGINRNLLIGIGIAVAVLLLGGVALLGVVLFAGPKGDRDRYR